MDNRAKTETEGGKLCGESKIAQGIAGLGSPALHGFGDRGSTRVPKINLLAFPRILLPSISVSALVALFALSPSFSPCLAGLALISSGPVTAENSSRESGVMGGEECQVGLAGGRDGLFLPDAKSMSGQN